MTKSLSKELQIGLLIVLALVVLYFGKDILAPLVISGILAMLFVNPARKLESKGLPRWASALIAVFLILLLFAGLGFLLNWQLQSFSEQLGDMKNNLNQTVSKIQSWIQDKVNLDRAQQKAIVNEQMKSGTGDTGLSLASTFFGILINFILVIVYTYLILFHRTRLKNYLIRITKNEHRDRTRDIVDSASSVAASYVTGLAKMILTLWMLYGIGFTALGVENALFFAIICGLLELVPFIGNLTGTALTLLGVMAQGGSINMIIGVIAVYALVQFVQTYLLEPLIVGNQVNINPLFTIFSLVLAEFLWGIPGMIVAIPVAGMIKILCDRIPSLQAFGYLIGSDK
ncbi:MULTISPECIES: AI-2E family transporter [Sphingobacterium]|uniref:AI-2E family transporter n=1 Tax=Sphingobacterium TaxID=28453 RepID=UPI0013DD4895|nr:MULTISPECIES: AI-2E family transporter [unclassified Sphingobacterium]